MGELARISEEEAGGRVILAHLGSGASLAAVRHGLSLDTSMGFTPTAGLVMGTRPGDLDPGIAWYLLQIEGLSPAEFRDLINHQSGLLGISGTSSDMKELLETQHRHEGAAEAVEFFCYQARKWIGAFAAALDGVDTVVFAGGIGERSAEIRSRICRGLGFLGIHLDEARNEAHAALISPDAAPVSVRVIPTNEELMIAKVVLRFLDGQRPDETLSGQGPKGLPSAQDPKSRPPP
jgi:acetate kinase